MPLYDYYCPTNRRTVEVRHSIHTAIHTWGDLVEAAQIDAGETPLETEVRRLISGGMVSTGTSESAPRAQASCGPRCACHSG